MLWFKPTGGINWGTKFQYLFEFSSSLECYFSGTDTLKCDSFEKYGVLALSTSDMETGEWTHVSVRGSTVAGSGMTLEQNTRKIGSTNSSTYLQLQ